VLSSRIQQKHRDSPLAQVGPSSNRLHNGRLIRFTPVTISRRLGHSSPVVTLTVYAHLFDKTDTTAAKTIEAAMTGF
jgi:integrase